MKIALVSVSATMVKTLPKNAIQIKAKSKIVVEDDKHESVIKRGEIFHIADTPKGCFLFDAEGEKFGKFSITKRAFNKYQKEHTVVNVAAPKKVRTGRGRSADQIERILGSKEARQQSIEKSTSKQTKLGPAANDSPTQFTPAKEKWSKLDRGTDLYTGLRVRFIGKNKETQEGTVVSDEGTMVRVQSGSNILLVKRTQIKQFIA